MAIAPELFHRHGDVSQMQDVQEILAKVVSKTSDAQVTSDLDAAIDYAAATGKADISRLGLTGFCWGGRIAWLFAASSPRLQAAVAWYGRLAGPTDDLHPRHPIDIAAHLKHPVLGLYGGADPGIPLDTVEGMRAAWLAADKNAEIVVYPEAGHAFFADYRPSYNQAAAHDGWHRMRKWFDRYLNQ
jgi:carboxymethylenebutenolidase